MRVCFVCPNPFTQKKYPVQSGESYLFNICRDVPKSGDSFILPWSLVEVPIQKLGYQLLENHLLQWLWLSCDSLKRNHLLLLLKLKGFFHPNIEINYPPNRAFFLQSFQEFQNVHFRTTELSASFLSPSRLLAAVVDEACDCGSTGGGCTYWRLEMFSAFLQQRFHISDP